MSSASPSTCIRKAATLRGWPASPPWPEACAPASPSAPAAGFPAELLAVRADRIEAALSLAYSRIVIHRGRVVSRTSAVREFTDTLALDLPRQTRSREDPA